MGDRVLSRTSYNSAVKKHVDDSGPSTRRGAEEVKKTGKLNQLVDPAEYGAIRRSLPRFDKLETGFFKMTIGVPMAVETRLDTTGSMGRNVDKAIRVLPDTYELCAKMLSGYDLQIAIGIFGDCEDNFVLCRPQFEMEAEKIVEQLTLMAPEGNGGGNGGEDPQYGLFGAAYLTSAYINRIGLKGYDFTVSDEPARYQISERQLTRIFGNQVFEKVVENGFQIDNNNLPTTKEIAEELLKRAHAFFLEVEGWGPGTHKFWTDIFGPERVVVLPKIELLPHVQAVIIGLTEGVLSLSDAKQFLMDNAVSESDAQSIVRSVANIPIGVQAVLRSKLDRSLPQKGDLFKEKTDLWPVNPDEIEITAEKKPGKTEPGWL